MPKLLSPGGVLDFTLGQREKNPEQLCVGESLDFS